VEADNIINGTMILRFLKNYYVPFFLLFFPLIIDISNGIVKGSYAEQESLIGVAYRGIIILYSLLYFKKFKYTRFLLLLIVCAVLSFSFHFFYNAFSFSSFSQFLKIIYGYCVLAVLLSHNQCKDTIIVCNCGISYAVGAALSLVICGLLGIGYSSYYDGTFGTKGFFIAMNDVGLVMIIMNALSLYIYQKTGKRFYFLLSLIIALGCGFVGSMAAYFGTALVFGAYVLNVFFIHFSDNKSSKRQKSFSIVLVCIIVGLAAKVLINIIMEDSYLSTKYEDVASNILEVSGRSLLIDAAWHYLDSQSIMQWIFGSGDQFSYAVGMYGGYGKVMKGVESDILDFIGNYGLLMTFLLLYLPIKYFVISLKRFLKKKELLYYWTIIISFLFWGHSIYGGHAFTSPMSMSYFVIIMYLIEQDSVVRKKRYRVIYEHRK